MFCNHWSCKQTAHQVCTVMSFVNLVVLSKVINNLWQSVLAKELVIPSFLLTLSQGPVVQAQLSLLVVACLTSLVVWAKYIVRISRSRKIEGRSREDRGRSRKIEEDRGRSRKDRGRSRKDRGRLRKDRGKIEEDRGNYVFFSEPSLGNFRDAGVFRNFWRMVCADGLRFGARFRL